MLKIYDVISMYKLNDGDWQKCGLTGYLCEDDKKLQPEKIIFENYNFNQCWQYLKTIHINGMSRRDTFFRHKPLVCIEDCRKNTYLLEKELQSISYKMVYKENQNVTLDWIYERLNAETAIEYLKQRGMTICPLSK